MLLLNSATEMALEGDDQFYSEFDHLGDDAARLQSGQHVARGEKLACPGGVCSYIPETHWETYRLPAG